MGQRRIDAVANESPHAPGILALPCRIDGKRNVRRPAGHGTCRKLQCVAHRFIASTTAVEHPRQHRDVQVSVVVDAHLALAVMQPVQSTDVLRDRSMPGDGKRQEQGVEPGVVESLADVAAGRQEHAILMRWNRGQRGVRAIALGFAHATAKDDQVPHLGREAAGQLIEMIISLGQNDRRSPVSNGLHDIAGDEAVAIGIGDQIVVEILELHACVGASGSDRNESPSVERSHCARTAARPIVLAHRRDGAPGHIA